MSGALAYNLEEATYELINGEVYMMSRPSTNHMRVERNIVGIFGRYLKGKTCEPFNETDVFFSEEDNFVPDVMIVCDPEIIEDDGIHGVPELVVEILSPSTEKHDKVVKYLKYEHYGVKEYWIVNPDIKSVDVYLLQDGRFIPSGAYRLLNEKQLSKLTDRQKSELSTEIKISLYDDFVLRLEDIFEDVK